LIKVFKMTQIFLSVEDQLRIVTKKQQVQIEQLRVKLTEQENCGTAMAAELTALQDKGPAPIEQWQPIETSPKNGTVILGYGVSGRVGMASKVPRDDCEMWTFCGTTADVMYQPSVKPTHWMPLPVAPEGAAK